MGRKLCLSASALTLAMCSTVRAHELRSCCLPDRTCIELSKPDCFDAGGSPGGQDDLCSNIGQCPTITACCLPGGTCQNLEPNNCAKQNGVAFPEGVLCLPDQGGKFEVCPSVPFCGDGIVHQGEQCDDGNNLDGDGCSATCELEPEGICLVIIDVDGIDNDMLSIEEAAATHGVEPDFLINDDRPTEVGNPPLRWNELFPGDVALLPTGQVDDEGWFALPPQIRYADDRTTDLTYEQWIAAYVAGTLPQDKLDKVRDVMPLRNQDLVKLVGRTCVAVVYDSDISMNFKPIYANLQGARYGLFTFTVLGTVLDNLPVTSSPGVELPGTLPESKSSTSLYDLRVRVEPPMLPDETFQVQVRDHEPDSIQITLARYVNSSQTLRVHGTSNFAPGAFMTVSVDDFILEAPMTYNPGAGRYEYVAGTPVNLDGRRVTISTDKGGAYNRFIE